jgi:formylglycine-generating enzyme required for sulfatase activity
VFFMALSLGACGSSGAGSGKDAAGSGGSAGARPSGSAGVGSSGSGGAQSVACTTSAQPGELVKVPGGDFTMGCNDAVDADCSDDEKPLHTVTLAAFEIDRTEVTQAEYTACVADAGCDPPSCDWNCDNASFAASCVAWAQANAYCAWAGERLPSEAEWEKAARGDQGNKYPWGNSEPDCAHANMAGCGDLALAVGSLEAGASPYGALDMAGNMVELVADWYDKSYYGSSPAADPTGPASGTRYSGRGGGFKSDAEFVRASKRDWYDAPDSAASLGFRCAR